MADEAPRMRRLFRTLPAAAAVLIVLAVYAFFASLGTFDFPRVTDWKRSNYASLAEGFRHGHLHMEYEPDPHLAALPYPWDPAARKDIFYLWDVSYFEGRYYLYFTALPVLLFYLPFRFLVGTYPADALAGAWFATWAFLAAIAFTRRALQLSGTRPLIPFPLWVLFIGIGNMLPFVITSMKMYEIAILSGTAMTSMWALALVELDAAPTAGRLAWVSVWLALAIAARPNLGVLLLVTAWAVARQVLKERRSLKQAAIAFVAPLAVVGLLMVGYNVARFREPFELGVKYQLTSVPMEHYRVCGVCNRNEVTRLVNHAMHYLFWPPVTITDFPYLWMQAARLDRSVTWPREKDQTEPVIGLAPLIPLTMVGTLCALVVALGFGRAGPGVRAALQAMAGGWLVLLGLSSCWWVVSRYSLDFTFLIVAASVVSIEAVLARLRELGVRMLPLRIAVALLACYSIVAAVLLALVGPGGAFLFGNRPVFDAIGRWLS